MPLIKFLEHIKKKNNLKYPHKGVVLDYPDPEQRGRIKCSVEGLFEGTATNAENLPWIYPLNNYGLGGSSDSSGFSVPQVGSDIVVTFPYNNIYAPFYSGYWQNEITHQSFTDSTTADEESFGSDSPPDGDPDTGSLTGFDEDYPKSYGWLDGVGNWIKSNMQKLYIKMMHSSGTWMKVFDNGDVQLQTAYGNKILIRNKTNSSESFMSLITQNGHSLDIREIDGSNNIWMKMGTAAGHELVLDDTSGSQKVKLTTNQGHYLNLDDENDSVELKSSDNKMGLKFTESSGAIDLETTGGVLNVKSSGNILVESTGGTCDVKSSGNMKVESTGGTCDVKSSGKCTVDATGIDLKGGGALAGIVNGLCNCAFNGVPHAVISTSVKATN